MKNKELYNLFLKFNIETLDSLCFLLDLSKKRDNNVQAAIGSVYENIYDKNMDVFNGRNAIDEQTRIATFDLSEVINKMDKLKEEELDVIYNLVSNAYNSVKKGNEVDKAIIPKLQIFISLYSDLKAYYKEVKDIENIPDTPEGKVYKAIFKPCSKEEFIKLLKANRFDDNFTTSELYNYFDKYSLTELEALKEIIDLEFDHNNKRILDILDKVYMAKYTTKRGTYTGPIKPSFFDLSKLSSKNEKLSDKEFDMFYEIVDSVDTFVSIMDKAGSIYQEQIGNLNAINEKEKEQRESKAKVSKLSTKRLTKKKKKTK